jgi:hypothetical protein
VNDARSVRGSCGYVLTDMGRAALEERQLCACRIVLDGGILLCRDCETIYGLLSQVEMGMNRPLQFVGDRK